MFQGFQHIQDKFVNKFKFSNLDYVYKIQCVKIKAKFH